MAQNEKNEKAEAAVSAVTTASAAPVQGPFIINGKSVSEKEYYDFALKNGYGDLRSMPDRFHPPLSS